MKCKDWPSPFVCETRLLHLYRNLQHATYKWTGHTRVHDDIKWHHCATLPPPNSFTTVSLVHYILVPCSTSTTTLVHILGQYPDHCQWSSFCCPGWFQYVDDALTCGMETVYSVCKKWLYALTIESFEQAEPNYLNTWNLLRQRSLV